TGTGCFVDDIQLPGMLHAVVVRSAVAHALITSIRTEAARALPGVAAVLTYADVADTILPIPLGGFTPLPGYDRFLQMPLARDRVVYVGEPIALVIADSRYIAEDAADLVEVDYDTLDAVVNVNAALRGDVLLHPVHKTNVATSFKVSRGDVAAAQTRATYQRRERFNIHRHSGVPLETRGMVAEWSEESQRMRVWGAAKLLYRNRSLLAQMLRLPETQIEMMEVDVGGGFGIRGEFYPEDFIVPFAARHLGRPIKWIEDRREHLMASNHSREMQCDLEIMTDAQGKILALRGHVLVDLGAYVRTNAGVAPGKVAQFIPGPYDIENAEFEVEVLLTNKTPWGSYRGPGRYESSYFRECLLDLAAADLGLDPAEFRRRNLIRPEQMPWDAGKLVPDSPATVYDTGNYPKVFARALQEFRYDELQSVRGRLIDGRYHGVGIGLFVESTGGGPAESARLRVTEGGRIALAVGSSSMGQGIETVMAQIAADELGLPMDAFTASHGSTTLMEKGWGAYHSRNAVMGGSAVILAARQLRDRLAALVAARQGLATDAVRYKKGAIVQCTDGHTLATLAQLWQQSQQDAELATALDSNATFVSNQLTYTFGAQLAHVAVDPETAAVDVLRFLTVEDVGRMLNPAIVHGQTLGASVQGLSSTFLDEFAYDEFGQLLSGTFADYLLATSTDFPNVEALSLEESPALSNPLGAKGAGEGGIAAVGGAVTNAVADALRSTGATLRELPLSPDKIARALRRGRSTP
ncbi:MAG: xanthine dehydrogenase family protein molybdopterin-binding subunit, partial [Burkholderiaceae bacterium]|nr:xanthine dehydrogenase family protein molybdopterin-binding subunit [Burkholderiaceae bacterium]